MSTLSTLHEEPTIDRRPPGSPGASNDLPPWVRGALWFGLFAVTIYVLAWLVGGLLRPGYDPAAQAISELFELGAPWSSRGPLVAGLGLSGLAFLVLAPALDRALPGSGRLGPVMVLVAGVGTLGVVAAPCTPGCPGAETSTFDLWHTITAGGGYTALVLAPLAFAWRVRVHEPSLARWSVLIGGSAGLLFLAHVLGLLPGAPGLLQRLFNTLADAWYVFVAVWLLRRDRLARRQTRPAISEPRARRADEGSRPRAR